MQVLLQNINFERQYFVQCFKRQILAEFINQYKQYVIPRHRISSRASL